MSPRRAVFTADSPTNPATPTAVKRFVGLGDLTEFNTLIGSDSAFAASWNDVQSQLQAEGQQDLTAAKIYMAGAFDQIANQPWAPSDTAEIYNAAHDFTLVTKSIGGAVQMVQGLAQAAESGAPPSSIIQTFGGTVLGIAAAAGASAATLGIGALVVAGVGAIVSALQSAGLILSPPADVPCNQNAWLIHRQLVIGCVMADFTGGTNTPVQAQNDPNWRHFPEASAWFTPNSCVRLGPPVPGAPPPPGFNNCATWGGGYWASVIGPRLVDAAWPQYRHLECEQNFLYAGGAGDFQKAFFGAWKTNAALMLNGQKAATDAEVLAHVMEAWNRSHSGSPSTAWFPRRGNSSQYMQSPGIGGDAVRNCADVRQYGSYIQYLIDDLRALGYPDLALNSGPAKSVPPIRFASAGALGGPGVTTSTTRKLAAGLVWGSVIALGGTVAYSLATKTPVTVVWQRAFDDVAKFVKRPLKAIKF